MNKKEGTRRIAVVLRVIGWLALGTSATVLVFAVVVGRLSSVGDGVPVLAVLGGLALGAAYVLNGFAGGGDEEGQSRTSSAADSSGS